MNERKLPDLSSIADGIDSVDAGRIIMEGSCLWHRQHPYDPTGAVPEADIELDNASEVTSKMAEVANNAAALH